MISRVVRMHGILAVIRYSYRAAGLATGVFGGLLRHGLQVLRNFQLTTVPTEVANWTALKLFCLAIYLLFILPRSSQPCWYAQEKKVTI